MINIKFPEEFHPSKSVVHARNELFIPASPESIWFWLTNAVTWPEWYPNSSNVVLIDQEEGEQLKKYSKFKWKTFGTNIISEVNEFVPNAKLAWVAKGRGLVAYHTWLIVAQDQGCQVITEETQRGWLPSLFSWFIKKGLLKQHQIWLEGLKMKAISHEK
ncbi:MAG: SRPBCC family protein [Bacteroidota bacterium]